MRASRFSGGAFIISRKEVNEPELPDGVAITGSDDPAGKFSMICFDERGTSQILDVVVDDGTVQWRYDNPGFAQSLVITAQEGGEKLISKGLMSKNGGP